MTSLPLRRLRAELRLFFLLTICYFILAGGWSVFFGVLGWRSFVAVFAVLWSSALWTFWNHREGTDRFDEIMLYLPLLVWFASFVAVKLVTWEVAGGRALWHSYGGDKGLANLLIEPSFVGIGASLYFRHWQLGQYTKISRRAMTAVALLIAALVAIVVPPLPE